MPKFRKKPVVIEAVQFFDDAYAMTGISELAGREIRVNYQNPGAPTLLIQTLEGEMCANAGDWIIKGVMGELYPCKPDIFALTYERVQA